MVRKGESRLGSFPYGTEMRNCSGEVSVFYGKVKSSWVVSVWYGNVKLLRGDFRMVRKDESRLGCFPYGTER